MRGLAQRLEIGVAPGKQSVHIKPKFLHFVQHRPLARKHLLVPAKQFVVEGA